MSHASRCSHGYVDELHCEVQAESSGDSEFKLKVVEIAEASGNRQAGREY